MSNSLNLEQYFQRLGHTGSRQPTVETLRALTRRHAQSIPFENIDVLLKQPIRLEPEALFDKLVVNRRGGYCFEQNGLFLAVLDSMGFDVRPLRAGIRLAEPDRNRPVSHTHLVLEVRIGEQYWLTDVGVGAASLTAPLRLVEDRQQPTPHESRRLVRDRGVWFHQIKHGDAWTDIYEFAGDTMHLPDRRVGNWYTSTHPDSHFTHDLIMARALPDGRRVTLNNHLLTYREADGTADKRTVSGRAELHDILHTVFGIELPAGTRLPVPDT